MHIVIYQQNYVTLSFWEHSSRLFQLSTVFIALPNVPVSLNLSKPPLLFGKNCKFYLKALFYPIAHYTDEHIVKWLQDVLHLWLKFIDSVSIHELGNWDLREIE